MSSNRHWMYTRIRNGLLTEEFLAGLETFIQFATSQHSWMDGERIKCPCKQRKCQNTKFLDVPTVKFHLAKYGFVSDYYVWRFQGECNVSVDVDRDVGGPSQMDNEEASNAFHTMVMDAAGPEFNVDEIEETPNPEAQNFYDMLKAADQELWLGSKKHSQLSLVARLMSLKSENHISEKCFNQFTELLKEVAPEDNLVPDNFYETKRLLRGMGLPVQKIDCCKNNCMIYWESDIDMTTCKFCAHPRFKQTSSGATKRQKTNVAYKKMYYFPLLPGLQRLYASNATANDMKWHAKSVEDGIMRHPSDSLAWKHFNDTYPNFASEIRNVRLGLCTDGFQPFGQSGQQYSSWPVILTTYNLPPWMCMKEEYMFLTVLVPGPKNPKEKIDVFLQPLIVELNQLWEVGVQTYDISKKQNFQMRAALMWTVSDFPAYSMLSGWSTAGRLACPYCMDKSDAFTLKHSGKQSWFDNHRKFLPPNHPFRRNKTAFFKNRAVTTEAPPVRSGYDILAEIETLGLKKVTELDAAEVNGFISKTCGWKKRSIFWDLPYWSSHLVRHNLDVMHIEKNVFDNVFNTVLDVTGKTKDTYKSREELNDYCRRPELKQNLVTRKFPKACYTLDKPAREALCEWVRNLKFPDGYASNMSRCVDMKKLKLFGMKSHDCHVFMQS
ncbi:PREDICTED: uncharacterized protein LOC109155282 [Ipomoea nil]|uniref:uncharacterized protein LOC109155282 n=1 Tax=Ipomoea nil TaxID=35883 RepID=UPI000900B0B1|nr:PREDICTED: uncharacterized protein LOC109155282 [Ipomoea nil]